jgi:hypothetical protein
MVQTSSSPTSFQSGYRLHTGDAMNLNEGNPILSRMDGITAHSGGGQQNAFQLTATTNKISTVAAGGDSVALQNTGKVGIQIVINDAAANALTLYGNYAEAATINDIATGTGVSIPAGNMGIFFPSVAGKWYGGIYSLSSSAGPAQSIAVGASATASNASSTYLLNAASGSVLTLPIATGSGKTFKVAVTTTVTSNSHKIITGQATDYLQGTIILQKAGTCSGFGSLISATNCSLQMPAAGTTPQGGTQGDWFELTDISANTWEVKGNGTAGGTVATPFSTATS